MEFSMVILAGGKSSRMGRDKSALTLGADTFLELQIRKGEALGIKDILVSGYRGEHCRMPMIPDRIREKGPLGGLEACLRRAAHEKVLVLGVDTLLLPVEELEKLMELARKSEKPVVLLSHGGWEEPLIGIYHRALADDMEQEIKEGKGKIFSVIRQVGYEVYESCAPEECFLNVNRPEDYEKLKKLYIVQNVE